MYIYMCVLTVDVYAYNLASLCSRPSIAALLSWSARKELTSRPPVWDSSGTNKHKTTNTNNTIYIYKYK